MFKGIKWTSADSMLTTFVQFLQNILLARLLSPNDFGLMSMIMVVLGFINPIFDLGLGVAIIKEKTISNQQLSTLFWINIILGFICFVLTILGAPIVASFFNYENLEQLLVLAGLVFIINPWGVQFSALMAKELRFDLQAKVSVLSTFVSFVGALMWALMGYGVLSLVYAFLLKAIVATVLNIYFGWQFSFPRWYFKFSEVRNLVKFGLFATGDRVINFFSANIDNILIGKVLGTYELGLYSIAWNLALLPLKKINPIINRIAFPVFSKITEEAERLNQLYKQMVFWLMAINIPVSIFLCFNSELILIFLYGEQWSGAAIALGFLSIVGMIKSFGNPGGGLLMSQGRADINFYWNIGWSIGLFFVLSIVLFTAPSIEAVAVGQVLAGLTIGLVWHYLIIYYGKINYKGLLKDCFKLLLFTLGIGFFTTFLSRFLDTNGFIILMLQALIFGLLYFIGFYYYFKERLMMLIKNFY